MNAAAGECRATVRAAPDAAPTLTLLFANSADAGLDRVVLLRRVAAGEYRGTCQAIPAGHWRVALEDAGAVERPHAGGWQCRADHAARPQPGWRFMSAVDALHARWSPDAGEHEHVVFLADGMHCAACARSIEKAVRALPDIVGVRVNNVTARVSVEWRGHGATRLPQILGAVTRAGFTPVPLAGAAASAQYQRERRAALKRLGLASLGMMQAMMYLVALYGVSDIDAAMTQLMRIAGMVIVTPVLFYSGAPFLAGAWRDLTHRRLGMDVPVALALLLAWLPSVLNTLRASGDVYFDSVGMFIFFLSAGRFVEMNVRHRSLSAAEALARSLPAQVTRLLARWSARKGHGRLNSSAGDRFLVPKGAVVAVDAQIDPDAPADARASLDEALISGESAASEPRQGRTHSRWRRKPRRDR